MRDGTEVGEGMTMEGGGGGWGDAGHDMHSLALLLVACNVTTPCLAFRDGSGGGGGLVDWQRSKTWVAEARNPGVPRWKRRRQSHKSWTEEGVGSRWVMPAAVAVS